MKYYLFLCLLLTSYASSAQKIFSVELKLIHPTGKLDIDKSYFELSITNNTDSTYHIIKGTFASGETIHTFVETELQNDNGTNHKGLIIGYSPVDFNNKKVKRIPPKQTLSVKLPLFYRDTEGIIPMNSEIINQLKQVRLNLNKFYYINSNSLKAKLQKEDLQTNWVTMDKSAFKRLLDEQRKKSNNK